MILDLADGTERCASCRHGLEPGEPYQSVEFGHVNAHGAPVPVVELWCSSCAATELAA